MGNIREEIPIAKYFIDKDFVYVVPMKPKG